MRVEGSIPVRVAMVDVYVLRQGPDGLETLLLRRAPGTRSPGSWECVHGHIDDGETPEQTARREVIEESGMAPLRLYNLSRVEMFYSHRHGVVALIPAFVALVPLKGKLVLSSEHDRGEWLALAEAKARVSWPRLQQGLEAAELLLREGQAGVLEDVLLVAGEAESDLQ